MAATTEVFVGRDQEMEALCAALDSVCMGNGRLVLIAGEPGIGKTRTALELTGHAERRDARTIWGRCHEEAGAPPYWPWAQILRALATSRDASELRVDLDTGAGDIASIVPEIRATLPDLDPPVALRDPSETRFRLFGAIARFLINVSRRQPLVLILDNLHWADVPSLRLLEFLAQEMADSRLLVIGTYRETELSRQHRLSDTLGALTRMPNIVRLHLSGLNAEDVRRFVATTAGIIPPAWLTSAIHAQTEGNPLFVREIVRFLDQQGHFSGAATAVNPQSGGTAPPTIRLPEGVREVIGRRLNLVSSACNEILAVAAVIGREFALDVLSGACQPRSEETVVDALDEALTARIIEETSPDRYQFTHALVRITLYDELRIGQRRRLHHAAGEAIEAAHRRDPEPVLADLAHHFRMSGMSSDLDRAIDYATRAGRTADTLLAYEDATGFFQNALDMLDTMSVDDPEKRCGLLFQLAESQRKTEDFHRALETFRAAGLIARQHGLAEMLAEVALGHAKVAWRHVAFLGSESGPMLEEALASLPETASGLRIKVMGLLARDRLHTGVDAEAKLLAQKAVAMARILGDPAVLATSLVGTADFPWEADETEQLLTDAIEMTEMAERVGDLETASYGYVRQAVFSLELGDIQSVTLAVAKMSRVDLQLRQSTYTVVGLGLKTTLALLRGSLHEAEQLILQIVRLQSRKDTPVSDAVSMQIFALRREQGRLANLGPMVSVFVRDNAASTWRPALALLYIEMDDDSAARAIFDELAGDEFASVPRDGRWTTCLVYLSEVCAALGDAERAAVLYRLLQPWADRNIVMGGGTGCWGSAARFLGMLANVMQRWLDAERDFTDALLMNQRVGALSPLAHTHCDYAAMLLARGYPRDQEKVAFHLREAGERASAHGLIALANRIAAMRDLSAVPARKPAGPDNLTARELEVLRLMAIGRGNADIALALDISQNTAARHVHNILTKSGCANRTEAAAYAVRHGLHIG